jgi:hypothetical protein
LVAGKRAGLGSETERAPRQDFRDPVRMRFSGIAATREACPSRLRTGSPSL